MGEVDEDLLLKNFFAEVSEVERDNEVLRFQYSDFLSFTRTPFSHSVCLILAFFLSLYFLQIPSYCFRLLQLGFL
uniref:Uncharacterized protein n=1 Tax=Nelumbo nucifera TaxID=4432 RepID=A0A822ZXT7_NELNU|nr:TPA_asm: hypothetical protein HUJ06_018278 [Nelumbo nucifera]